jgi:site-specific DNA-methyltransferase (adenine-specific)
MVRFASMVNLKLKMLYKRKIMLELNQVYHGDCLEVMKDIPDGSVDMICSDPPYGTTACAWDSVIPLESMWAHLKRVIKPNGAIVMTASQPFTSVLTMSNIEMLKHEWIWEKNRGSNFGNTNREPMKEHEHVLVIATKGWTYNKQMQERKGGGKNLIGKMVPHHCSEKFTSTGHFKGYKKELSKLRVPSSIQKFNCETGSHPTQKPVALMEYLIKTYTNEGETVLDFCMGSGTTGVACKITKRKFIGIEKDKEYIEIAKNRIENPEYRPSKPSVKPKQGLLPQ